LGGIRSKRGGLGGKSSVFVFMRLKEGKKVRENVINKVVHRARRI